MDDLGDFGGGGGESDEVGATFFYGAVVFVEDKVFGAGEDRWVAEKFFEGADEVARGRVCRVVGHGGIRLAQMGRGWEMTRGYIEEELSGRIKLRPSARSLLRSPWLNRLKTDCNVIHAASGHRHIFHGKNANPLDDVFPN